MLKKIDIDRGIYQDALSKNVSVSEILENHDPSENYKGTPWEGKDSFQRQLAVRGLSNHASLELFFDSDNRALFPEFISRNVNMGKQIGKNEALIEDIVGVRTYVDSGVYNAPTISIDDNEVRSSIAEGAQFPQIEVSTGNRTVTLSKYGFAMKMSYEARRRVSLGYVRNVLMFMGKNWNKQQVSLALDVAIASGCGSDTSDSSGTLSYDDLVDFNLNFNPFNSNIWIGDKTTVGTILKMTEFKDPLAGFNFQKTGKISSPMGNNLKMFTGSLPSISDLVVGIDSDFALEIVREKRSSIVEVDRIVNGQWEEIDVSEVIGFSRMHDEAVRKLDFS
jgi:hypothetical protein